MLSCEICGSTDVRQTDEGILCMKCQKIVTVDPVVTTMTHIDGTKHQITLGEARIDAALLPGLICPECGEPGRVDLPIGTTGSHA